LEGEDLEKLKLARTKYQQALSVVPLPCAVAGGNNHGRPQTNVSSMLLENSARPKNKDFRSPVKAKS